MRHAGAGPLNLARILWDRWLPYPWNLGAWIGGVGVLWHCVARSIARWRERREGLVVSWRYGRLLIDAVLVAIGALFGVLSAGEAKEIATWAPSSFRGGAGCFGGLWWSAFLRSLIAGSLYLGWCVALVPLFVRDFVQCLRSWKATAV
jgi:hypothetical protein